MPKILAFYGSPRREGNTALLLKEAVLGASTAGAEVEEIVLRDLNMSPCLEIYGCKTSGRCVIQDDYQKVYDQILSAHGIMLASPVFFYSVSAHTKILMDRGQSLWVKKNWMAKTESDRPVSVKRKGLFISVGATRGKKLFDGCLLAVRYYFEAIDCELWRSLVYRELDFEGDVKKHATCLEDARSAGRELCRSLEAGG